MKMWWHEEPIIVGSLRWTVIYNDLNNNIRDVLKQLKYNTSIEEAVRIAHDKGLHISFELIPR